MADKLKAFELYGKAMGFYTERREISGPDGASVNISVEFVDPTRAIIEV